MSLFIKPFYGVPAGAIYPRRYQVGEACPQELIAAAQALGAFGKSDQEKPKKAEEEKTQKAAAAKKME